VLNAFNVKLLRDRAERLCLCDFYEVPNIPYLAEGGIVTGPTLAMIGERGPEAVIPLSGRNSGMGGNYTINITGGLSSSADIGKAVVNAIRQFNLTNGPANIQVA